MWCSIRRQTAHCLPQGICNCRQVLPHPAAYCGPDTAGTWRKSLVLVKARIPAGICFSAGDKTENEATRSSESVPPEAGKGPQQTAYIRSSVPH